MGEIRRYRRKYYEIIDVDVKNAEMIHGNNAEKKGADNTEIEKQIIRKQYGKTEHVIDISTAQRYSLRKVRMGACRLRTDLVVLVGATGFGFGACQTTFHGKRRAFSKRVASGGKVVRSSAKGVQGACFRGMCVGTASVRMRADKKPADRCVCV